MKDIYYILFLLIPLFLDAKESPQFDESLNCHRKLWEKTGNANEALYLTGKCNESTEKWDKALQNYLEVYQRQPQDPAPLRAIANHYLKDNQFELAHLFAKQASQISNSDFQIDEILSLASFYTQYKEDGYNATDRLILKKNTPKENRELAYQNMFFYFQPLANTTFEPIVFELPLTRQGSQLHYNPMNATILKTDSGYLVVCRTVNYKQEGSTGHRLIDPDDKTNQFRTKNYLLQYDRDFKLQSQKEIVENLPRTKFRWWNAEGPEDCRAFMMNDSLWFACTTCDTNVTGKRQMSLCKLAKETDGKIPVEKLIPLKGPNPNRCEKNWVPFFKENVLHMIYSYDPLIVYKPNIDTGDVETVSHVEPKHFFAQFRGSTSPIELDDGYLILIHEAVPIPDRRQFYMHRFLFLDKNLVVTKASKPFYFKHKGVEFTCGMTIDHSGKRLVIPMSVEDREAYFAFVDVATVLSLLQPLP